jgi:hypothetical protein
MGITQTFGSTVEIDGQDALHLVGFQPFLTLLDTENNQSVRAGIQNLGGSIGFFSGSSNPMTIRNSGTVEINTQDALHLVGFQPFLTLLDTENNQSARAGIQNVNGNLQFFSGSIFSMHIQKTGDVSMGGTLSVAKDVVLAGGDCAEHFDAMPDAICEPGTVMTISNGGALDASTRAYDKKVAGIVSGAGSFRPAILLDKQASNAGRPPIALSGKVYCKVDAEYAAIEIGDLLTSSDTLGHAMKAIDPARAFGAVVGKALGPLSRGRGIIPILVSLQ